MSPDWLSPAADAPTAPSSCATCDGPLEPGRRVRCLACTAAARRAIDAAGPGVTVRPSDVERERHDALLISR